MPYNAITDCGAGGLSSAVGEMANRIGAEVDIALVRLKYPGLAPWEIWLSEAQERMVLAVPPANLSNLQELCAIYDVELTDIGTFTGSQKLVVKYGSKVVLELDNTFLHEGIPQRQLIARAPNNKKTSDRYYKSPKSNSNIETTLLMLLAHPNIASKENVMRIYDHEVQGATVVKPLTGVQNDGLSNGINPEYGKLDAYCMALSVVDEAVRNVVAVGANPERIAILDNFCWGDPLRLEVMWSLIEAGRGCYEAAIAYQAPFISGKDSFNNEYLGSDSQRHSIPPTLLISALGLIEDHSRAITMDFKRPGDMLFLVGEFQPTFGGSHFDLISGTPSGMPIPSASAQAPQVYRRLHQAITNNLVRACHDLSEGGLAVTLAEMSIGGRLGAQIKPPPGETQLVLFGETNGCLVAEIDPKNCAKFETIMADQPYVRIGEVVAGDEMVISYSDQALLSLPVNKLLSAWSGNPPG
jgi:phosphoribosylformylglycinamidine (FGAM) synthase-like enzyme